MNKRFSNYHSYLIRFWRMDNGGQPVWRVGLEEPGTPTQLYFESLAALFVYLATQLEPAEAASKADDDGERDG